jgi:hypothetical protein
MGMERRERRKVDESGRTGRQTNQRECPPAKQAGVASEIAGLKTLFRSTGPMVTTHFGRDEVSNLFERLKDSLFWAASIRQSSQR